MNITMKGLPGFKFLKIVGDNFTLTNGGLISVMQRWARTSKQRRDLGQLSEHQLKDIGITPDSVKQETTKPFWAA